MRKLILLVLMLSLNSFCIASSQEQYPFVESAQSKQFQRLLKELRCLVCQNQDLADSNATLAQDLKKIVYQKVQQHQTDDQIKSYLVKRYGDFVLFNPPVKQTTYLLWFGPFLMLVIGLVCLLKFVRRMNHE